MQVILNDLMTSYDVFNHDGDTTVLLLHGWGDKASGLQQLAQWLAETHRVIVPDLPGFGATDAPKMPWGLSEYAAFVESFLKKVNIQPHIIIGHSNGGAIAIRGLSTNVLHSDKLVLLASSGIRSEYQGKKKMFRIAAKSAKSVTRLLPAKTQLKLKKQAYRAIGSDMFVAEHMQETFKIILNDDVQADAAKLRIPTLLLYGDQDSATPPYYGELFANLIPNATLKIIPGAGHFVHRDARVEVQQFIKEFMS